MFVTVTVTMCVPVCPSQAEILSAYGGVSTKDPLSAQKEYIRIVKTLPEFGATFFSCAVCACVCARMHVCVWCTVCVLCVLGLSPRRPFLSVSAYVALSL